MQLWLDHLDVILGLRHGSYPSLVESLRPEELVQQALHPTRSVPNCNNGHALHQPGQSLLRLHSTVHAASWLAKLLPDVLQPFMMLMNLACHIAPAWALQLKQVGPAACACRVQQPMCHARLHAGVPEHHTRA